MKIRRDVLVDGGFTCVDCGHVSMSNQIDHDIPLEQGGSHDKNNLRIRCPECHAKKTAAETKALFSMR
jgi:5-methylcytosine-specific restriction protein A